MNLGLNLPLRPNLSIFFHDYPESLSLSVRSL
ncbi:hypothetical protein ES332_D02G209300v1 [Gossypium tomentosum]|uniref:Uncharacterized protein n=1 Tax=Gossypium tomentosum TaxID=34277 RepID=A0A5D2LZV4_GOSTO|nr:hypothetical protein ES332_D02G209300v1 [Gossypium tomentosum]